MKGKRNAQVTAHNDRAWLAWYTAYMPNMKRPVRLADLQVKVGEDAKRAGQTPAEINTVMRKWKVAVAFAAMDTTKKPGRLSR